MKSVLSVKIEKSIIERTRKFCFSHGLKQGFFVENAIKKQLDAEEMAEDITEMKELRVQEMSAGDFSDYLKKRRK